MKKLIFFSVIFLAFIFLWPRFEGPSIDEYYELCRICHNDSIMDEIKQLKKEIAREEGDRIIGPFYFGMTERAFQDSLSIFLKNHEGKILLEDHELMLNNDTTIYINGKLRRLGFKYVYCDSNRFNLQNLYREKYELLLILKEEIIVNEDENEELMDEHWPEYSIQTGNKLICIKDGFITFSQSAYIKQLNAIDKKRLIEKENIKRRQEEKENIKRKQEEKENIKKIPKATFFKRDKQIEI